MKSEGSRDLSPEWILNGNKKSKGGNRGSIAFAFKRSNIENGSKIEMGGKLRFQSADNSDWR